jgi:hypothetical protein
MAVNGAAVGWGGAGVVTLHRFILAWPVSHFLHFLAYAGICFVELDELPGWWHTSGRGPWEPPVRSNCC